MDPAGFEARQPGTKRPFQKDHQRKQDTSIPLVLLGPYHRWGSDGLGKFTKAGFGIWGIRDIWSGKWLGLWVVPNVRFKAAIAYMYLNLIMQLGGEHSCRISVNITSLPHGVVLRYANTERIDRGRRGDMHLWVRESTQVRMIGSTMPRFHDESLLFREASARPQSQEPDQQFLQSIENATFAKGKSRLTLEWGDEFYPFWQAGQDIYNLTDTRQWFVH